MDTDENTVIVGEDAEIELNDDMTFDKPIAQKETVELQKEVVEFVTSTILRHEEHLTKTVTDMYKDSATVTLILGSSHAQIVQMIVSLTNSFYNTVYQDVQNHIVSESDPTDLTKLVISMSKHAGYGPHILLEKLVGYTTNCHTEIIREELDMFDSESYNYTVLDQINRFIKKNPPINLFRKQAGDDTEFVVVPDGQKAFNVTVTEN